MEKAQKTTVLLNVKYGKKMPGETVELSEEDANRLIKGGYAVEVEASDKESGEDTEVAPTQEEIVAGLDLDDEDKAYLLENLGDFNLELKKDKTLNKKSADKVAELLEEEE